MKNISSKSYVLLAGLPLLYLTIFYFYPLIKIFTVSFIPDEAWGPGNLKKLVTSSIYLRTLWFTTWQAMVSTVLTLLLAPPVETAFRLFEISGSYKTTIFATLLSIIFLFIPVAWFLYSQLEREFKMPDLPHVLFRSRMLRW